jgi:hypothetical protein
MRKTLAVLFVAAALALAGASVASAGVVTGTRSASTFVSNDALNWGLLGVNNFFVANGATISTSTNNILTTVTFWTGGTGATYEQCPTGTCTWSGNFSPGQELLTDINNSTGGTSGRIILSFATPISAIGFQLEPNASSVTFATEIAVYDGSTLLTTWYFPDGVEADHLENNSAGFYGVISTAPDITSIQVLAYNCGGVGGACLGFAINSARIEDSKVPEPASLALLGSGLGMLGFLRRKLAARK